MTVVSPNVISTVEMFNILNFLTLLLQFKQLQLLLKWIWFG